MAQSRQIQVKGRVFATPSAMTVLVNGNEVFSGQVGTGQPLDTEITLATITANLAGNAYVTETVPVSISVTSGVVSIGEMYANNQPGTSFDWLTPGIETRENILINGTAPEWPATPVFPMPGGTPEDPNWTGWFFELSAGETMTCTFDVIGQFPA